MNCSGAMDGGDLGGTMRLGAYPAALAPAAAIAEIYGATEISERHRHRYEVNIGYGAARAARHAVLRHVARRVLPEIVEYPTIPGSSACSSIPS